MGNRRWRDEEIGSFKRDYEMTSVKELAEKYDRSEGAIYSRASTLGLSHREFQSSLMSEISRKYKFDEHYFDEIDSFEKAYFLGLLYADGSVLPSRNLVELGVATRDMHILEDFCCAVGSDRPVLRYVDRRSGRGSDGSRINFSSSHMVRRLCELGCGPRKTFKVRFPSWLSDNKMPAFVRGYFDGDGSFFVSARTVQSRGNRYRCASVGVGITGNVDFVQDLHSVIAGVVGVRGVGVAVDKRREGVSSLNLRGKSVLLFLEWIYAIDGPRLKRKHELFCKFQMAKKMGLRGGVLVDYCKGVEK